jgi:predicted Rossmann-fold nucleotide-binding protein
VILVGKDYWRGLIDWIREATLAGGKISKEDLGLMLCTDDPDEVVKVIVECYEQGCADLPAISAATE